MALLPSNLRLLLANLLLLFFDGIDQHGGEAVVLDAQIRRRQGHRVCMAKRKTIETLTGI
jgi:hypothetical protein